MHQSAVLEKSQNITRSSTASLKNNSTYKIAGKAKHTISDDFYTKKKVTLKQEQLKLKNFSARKIQKFFRSLLAKRKLKKLLSVQKKSAKPVITYFNLLSAIYSKSLSKYWKMLKYPTSSKQALTFDISNLKIKPELLEKITAEDKGMISYICDGMQNETQTFIKDPNESQTFLKVFNEEKFTLKEFNNFEEMNFSRFDFMEIELPSYVCPDINASLYSGESLCNRITDLQEKIQILNQELLKEFFIKESLIEEKEILRSIIRKLINLKRFN